jgi:hypothetical protein
VSEAKMLAFLTTGSRSRLAEGGRPEVNVERISI